MLILLQSRNYHLVFSQSLEERHGVEIGTAYQNYNYDEQIIDYVSEKLPNDLKVAFTSANFYSVLSDGLTHASITEKEAIFTVHFYPLPNREDHAPATLTGQLPDFKTANLRGFIEAIDNLF